MSGAAAPPGGLGAEFKGRSARVLERLNRLYPSLIDLSLSRLERLLARLGHPERKLPPVFHVAGTNGKGSTCANLRAILEAAGMRVHVSTSPHLVCVIERFRIAGALVSEDELISVLEDMERLNAGAPITVFEVLTAAGFVLFARHPADAVVLEVGLGGRYDATNVIPRPACSVITPIALDHEAFLGDSLAAIATEKAGIIKPGCPVATGLQAAEVMPVINRTAHERSAPLWRRGEEWAMHPRPGGMDYEDRHGRLSLPPAALMGPYQRDNAALAVAAVRASGLGVPAAAFNAISQTHWPARLQALHGPLRALLPPGWELWVDGGHNPHAGAGLAGHIKQHWSGRPVHLIIGMKQTKDAAGFLAAVVPHATSVHVVAEPGQHLAIAAQALAEMVHNACGRRAVIAPTVRAALDDLAHKEGNEAGRALVCGSLYLAGVVLEQDGYIPR